MTVQLVNAQREAKVEAAHLQRLARCAVSRLGIRSAGCIAITLVSERRIRAVNRRFLGHDRVTDVISFRYEPPPGLPRWRPAVIGDIVIAPRQARVWARAHGVPYAEELARYVVHGLLHWLGHEDRTRRQQARMRRREDAVLASCGLLNGAQR